MKSKAIRIFSILMLVILLLVLGTLAAGAIAKSNLAKQFPAPGQLVDVGGYRLHINCVGQGSPTVLLEAGLSEFSLVWAYVQPVVAKTTRVCSYDRAGYGWSEPSPYPRTADMMVEELHTLLVNANLQGPYVLAGHSMGGVLVRVYTHNYPEEVVGMVLVDSTHEEQFSRYPEAVAEVTEDMMGQLRMFSFLTSTGLMALAQQSIPDPGLPKETFAQYQAALATGRFFETWVAEWNALEGSYAEVLATHMTSFENMPLIVLSAGRWEPTPLLSEVENQQVWEVIQEWQSGLVGLSSEGKQVIAEQSGHHIQLDQPKLVIDAIQQMVDVIRK